MPMSGCTFEKLGTVRELRQDGLVVRLAVSDACAACSRKDCGLPRARTEDVFVVCDAAGFSVGEEVLLTLPHSKGFHAVCWACVLPLLLVLSVLGAVHALTGDEAVAGIAGVLALLPYYGLLWLLRSHMRQSFKFKIAKR